jgi:penicillin G amidase
MIKKIIIILLSILWVVGTFYPIAIFTNAGTLFTYNTGIFSLVSPDSKENIKIQSNQAKNISIHIDNYGVPHIYADDADDLAFGIGFMQARDRYFQMELITRMVQGTLAERLGEMVVKSDEFWAPYQFERKALEVLKEMKTSQPDVYNYMVSYAAGINAYLNQEKANERSPEFVLLGTQPRKWETHYPLFLIWYMSHSLTYYDAHISRQNVLNKLKNSPLMALYNPYVTTDYPYIAPDTVFNYTSSYTNENVTFNSDDESAVSWIEAELFKSLGSNNWSVGAIKSATGNSMLCNDPHLDLTLPGPWYEVRMFCKDYSVAGFSIPCSPWVISGHNENISWGVTNGEWDLLDRILLETNEKEQYKANGEWLNFSKLETSINVKNEKRSIEKQFTVWGPVEEVKGKKYALRWYPAEKHASVITFHKLAKANNWSEFNEALSYYKFPPQNFVYADKDGNTGLKCAGNLPYKPQSFDGGLLSSNTSVESDYVPFDKMSGYFNNKRGFSSSANQISAKTNYYLNFEWPENYRAKRINTVLSSKDKLDQNDMMALQYDKKDISFDEFKPLLEKFGTNNPDLEPLKNWDGVVQKDSYPAALYTVLKLTIRKELAEIMNKKLKVATYPNLSSMYAYLLTKNEFSFSDTTFSTESYFIKTVESAKMMLKNEFGDSYLEKANHNNASTYVIKHLLQLPGWGVEAENASGNAHTPNVITYKKHGASMRTLIEMSQPVNAKTIQAGGQSGRVNSKQYANQVELWKIGKYKSEQFTSPDKLENIVQTIQIN